MRRPSIQNSSQLVPPAFDNEKKQDGDWKYGTKKDGSGMGSEQNDMVLEETTYEFWYILGGDEKISTEVL